MNNLVLLDNNIHRNMKVNPAVAESHGAYQRSVPVMLSEFAQLLVQYPIVITKNSETGQFICVTVFGFEKGENLFWKNNAWDAIYLPLNIARQPFFAGLDDQSRHGQNNFVVCVDSTSDSLQEKTGERLFDDKGKESVYLQKMTAVLSQLLAGEKETDTFVKKLLTLDLLTPMSLDIRFVNDEQQCVNGLYTVDEEKLKNLQEQTLIELHSSGYLQHIYAMIASLGQFYVLINRKNAMLTTAKQWFQSADAG